MSPKATQTPPVTNAYQLRPGEIPHVGIYKSACPKCYGPRNEFSGVCGHCGVTSVVIYSNGGKR